MSEVSDEDLHDVFRILYADEDDWGMLDEVSNTDSSCEPSSRV